MITVGLINELSFISEHRKTPVCFDFYTDDFLFKLTVKISKGFLEIMYRGEMIWREDVVSGSSMFGIESCDSIAKIIFLINQGSLEWRELVYKE